MKFIIRKDEILDVLSKVQGITGRKSNLAITTNVLISTNNYGIIIIATDLETGYEGLYSAKIESQGKIAINARKFYEIVREFPSDEIHVEEFENHWIKISNEKVEYNIVGMNPNDFPESPQIEDIEFISIDSIVFKKMIDRTVLITGASDEKRAHIIGINFEVIHKVDKNIVRMVSTDGNRLSKVDCFFEKDIKLLQESNIIIPKKGMNEVIKFLDSEGKVKIGFKNNNFIVKKEAETIIIRLLEGEFPEYSEIIKKRDSHEIHMDRELFLMMLKRMSIFYSEDYKGVVFNFSDGKLFINAVNPDFGESKEDMDIDYKGDPIEVAFNPRYFIETLNVIDSDKVVINIIDEEKPCMIEGEKDNTFLSIIMPMRL